VPRTLWIWGAGPFSCAASLGSELWTRRGATLSFFATPALVIWITVTLNPLVGTESTSCGITVWPPRTLDGDPRRVRSSTSSDPAAPYEGGGVIAFCVAISCVYTAVEISLTQQSG
jgi:hypothetical protein